jgi:hypothetical protein
MKAIAIRKGHGVQGSRDRLSRVVMSTPLEPQADLKAVLTGARETRIAERWAREDIGPSVAFFFCSRDGARQMVSIEHVLPPPVGKLW